MTTNGPDGPSEPSADEPRPSETTSTFSLGSLGLGAHEDATTEGGQEGASDDDAGAVEALASGTALLVVQRGPNAGSRYLLDVRRHDGRPPSGQRRLPRRRHGLAPARRVPPRGGGFRVVDVGSLNGTYVNRQRIDDALLSGGDEVQIGKYRLLYFPAAPAGGGGVRRPARAYMNIGEVLARLRPDFPDVTISKIRFLESEGLVEPQRTASGYRKFDHDDVLRLRYVLGAQRDHYLPLKVIKDHLDALDRGLEPPVQAGAAPRVPMSLVAGDGMPGPRGLRP